MEKSVELLLAKLTELCQVLGLKVTEFYPYVMRKMITQAWLKITIPLMLAIVFSFMVSSLKKKAEFDNFNDPKDFEAGLFMGSLLVAIVCWLIFIIGGSFSFHVLLNPEYYAIREIIDMVKP